MHGFNQSVQRVEFQLRPDIGNELYFQPLTINVGIEIEEMRLQKRVANPCRGCAAEIGNAVQPVALPVDPRAYGIDAVFRMDEIAEVKVRRREAQFAAVLFAALDHPVSHPPKAHHLRRDIRLAGMQRLADRGRRGLGADLDHFVHNGDTEPERAAKARQALGVTHTAPAETEIKPD